MKKTKTSILAIILLLFGGFIFSINAQTPTITQQPLDQGTIVNNTATFSIAATGADTILYQWRKDGVDIAGATSSSYTTPPTVALDNHSVFSCVVSDTLGASTVSDNATLYVTQTGARVTESIQTLYDFNEQAGSYINDHSGVGTALNFKIYTTSAVSWTLYGLKINSQATIKTSGAATKVIDACKLSNEITIEAWVKPDVNDVSGLRNIITNSSGLNERNFTLGPLNNDLYEVRMRTTSTDNNGLPSVGSANGTVGTDLVHIVYARAKDGSWKIFINGNENSSGTLTGDFSNWDDRFLMSLANELNANLPWKGTYYQLAIYNRHLTPIEVSENYSLGTEHETVAYIATQPNDQVVNLGENATFNVVAVGNNPLSYKWQKNGVNISGANNSSYTIINVLEANNGEQYRCIVSNNQGIDTSSYATLRVLSPNQRVDEGTIVMYKFRTGSGNTVFDLSGSGTPLNLDIISPGSVTWTPQGLVVNSTVSIRSNTAASKIYNACTASQQITVETWIKPASASQTGPARILTVSQDGLYRNFTLSQNGDKYEFRIRSTKTNENGVPFVDSPTGTVQADWQHVVYIFRSDGVGILYINGQESARLDILGDFSNWNDTYRLALANEFVDSRPWLGTLNYVAIFDRQLSPQEILHNYSFGPVGVVYAPSQLIVVSNTPYEIALNWQDNSDNESGFVIERGEGDPINYTVLDTVGVNQTSYSDSTFAEMTVYTYRVKAINNEGESDYSNTVSVTSSIKPIAAPSNLSYSLDPTYGVPILTWTDNSDNEDGFKIERRVAAVGSQFEILDSVGANITTIEDGTVTDSTIYIYRIFAYNANTISDYSPEITVEVLTSVEEEKVIPTEFSLNQNYPNPFNPTTTIKFGLPSQADVNLSIYNLLGQKILDLAKGNYSAGWHTINFDASQLTSGIYIYSISAHGSQGKNFVQSKKMILLK